VELPGTGYLLNLSLLELTFAAVSALVMLLRQTMGGKLSNFDVYLIATYIAQCFAQAVAAILPVLVSLFTDDAGVVWETSSIAAIALIGGVTLAVLRRRRIVTGGHLPLSQALAFVILGLAVVLLLANATLLAWQGIGLYALAITVAMAGVMWGFVRRIASLLGPHVSDDWDPGRG